MEPMKKKLIIGITLAVVLLAAILTGSSLYMIDYSLRPDNRGKDMQGSEAYMRQTYPHITGWLDSLQTHHALRDTFITAPDGVRMHAFYASASRPTRRTAVIVHGYTDNAIRMFHIGYLYNQSLITTSCCPTCAIRDLPEGMPFRWDGTTARMSSSGLNWRPVFSATPSRR